MKKEQIETNRISDEINKQKREKIGNEQSHGEQKKERRDRLYEIEHQDKRRKN